MTSSILLKKQEELNSRAVRDLLRLPENKKCFDCPTKSPFFVNVTLQTFICSRCSGLVREVGHRVKSISASKFTGPELVALEHGGNGIAGKIWLSCGYNTVDTPEPESDGEVRAFMRQKYYERKWLDHDLAASHDQFVKDRINELFDEEGMPKQQRRRRATTIENTNTMIPSPQQQRLKNVPGPLDISSANKYQQPSIQTAPLIMNSLQPQPKMVSPKQPTVASTTSSSSVPVSPASSLSSNPIHQKQPPMNSIFSDLAGLSLSPSTAPTLSSQVSNVTPITNHRASYTGGVLTPSRSPAILTPTSPSSINHHDLDKNHTIQPIATTSMPRAGSDIPSNHKRTTSLQHNDPYSALRDHHQQHQQRQQQMISAIMSTSKSSAFVKNDTNKLNDNDPYAALRQLSDQPVQPVYDPAFTSFTTISSSPKQEQQQHRSSISHQSPRISQSSDGSSWQGKSYSTVDDDWVEAEPYQPNVEDEDEDVMTQISSTTTHSTTSSTKSNPVNNNLFNDLDPLANYKRNKLLSNTSSS